MKDNKNRITTIAVIVSILSIGFALFAVYNNTKIIKSSSSTISNLKSENAELKNQITKFKKGNLKKYSADFLNKSSMNVKPNVDSFFKVINNWNGDNYATRRPRALKFASEDVVKNFVGGSSNANGVKQQAKQLKVNKATRKITESHWFTEKTTGENVNGLYIITTESSVQNTNTTTQQQIYLINYNILDQKITKAQPVDLSNNSLKNIGN